MGKSRGIVIELTALLDVIFIMLFWVIINVQESSETVKAEAQQRVEQAESQAQEEIGQAREETEETREELEKLRAEMQEELERLEKERAEAQALADNADADAVANERALMGYEQGRLLTLNLRYEDGGRLYISGGGDSTSQVGLESPKDIYATVISELKAAGLSTGDVVMCAMVYDGDKALYRDVKTVRDAVGQVSETYSNLYCAYINTSGDKN
ncbi:MAG: hypothetical protein IJ806_05835 [Ruminococcus sp.]|nr:hypothetical protein [Ruminococcus sp.]